MSHNVTLFATKLAKKEVHIRFYDSYSGVPFWTQPECLVGRNYFRIEAMKSLSMKSTFTMTKLNAMSALKRYFNRLSLLSLILLHTPSSGAAGWTNHTYIVEINQQPATVTPGLDNTFLETSAFVNPTNCTKNDGVYFLVNDARSERVYSTMLAALVAGKEVRFYLDDDCHTWGYPKMSGFTIR